MCQALQEWAEKERSIMTGDFKIKYRRIFKAAVIRL